MILEKLPPQRLWIKNPIAVLSEFDCKGGVVVVGGKIVELVTAGSSPATNVDAIFDASRLVLIPGLINTHHHFYQTLTRAFSRSLNQELFSWLLTLYPVWANLRPCDISISSRLAMVELLLSGCTTTVDHHYVFSDSLTDAIDIQIEEANNLGIRAVLTRGSMSLGESQGGLPPNSIVQDDQTILDDSARLIKNYHCSDDGAMIQISLAPCSPFSVSSELMRATAALSKMEGVRLHTHLAETTDEHEYCQSQFGLSPLEYLADVGWLSDRTWLAHGIHFNEHEISALGKERVGISHCASANMVLASGICPVVELENAGCPMGLGVDGSASNDCSNMIQELRLAFLLQRLKYGSRKVSHLDALRWATSGAAACLGRSDIGTIAVGAQADLALFSLDEPRFSGFDDPIAALILCGAHKASYVMVQGKWIVEKGTIPGVDLPDLLHSHNDNAKRLRQSHMSLSNLG